MVSIKNIKKGFNAALELILSYYRFKDWFTLRAKKYVTGVPHHELRRIDEFWERTLQKLHRKKQPSKSEPIRDGDIVSFKDGFLSDWVPLIPGFSESSTRDCSYRPYYIESLHLSPTTDVVIKDRKVVNAFFTHSDFHLFALSRWNVNDYFGLSVRLPHLDYDDFYAFCSMTDIEKFDTYSSIPVVLSKAAYVEYRKKRLKENVVNVDVTGIVRVNTRPTFKDLLRQVGLPGTLPLASNPVVPDCWIQVFSPLDIKCRFHPNHPMVTAWSIISGISPIWIEDAGVPQKYLERLPFLSQITFNLNTVNPVEIDPQRTIEAFSERCPNARILVSADASVEYPSAEIDMNRVFANKDFQKFRHTLELFRI
jgi:hypothetical protein